MKYFIHFYYILRSLILRGPLNSIRLISNEAKYEKQFKIHTSEFIRSASSEYFHYQGASYLVLFRLFKELDERVKTYSFIDIGSGKGRVVFVAEHFGFNDLTGIELNEKLVKEANENLERYISKREASHIRFITKNALEVEYENRAALYFLFNPFSAVILKKVLEKIIKTSTHETWFIYMNPLYKDVFNDYGIQEVKRVKSGFYTEAIIYKISGK